MCSLLVHSCLSCGPAKSLSCGHGRTGTHIPVRPGTLSLPHASPVRSPQSATTPAGGGQRSMWRRHRSHQCPDRVLFLLSFQYWSSQGLARCLQTSSPEILLKYVLASASSRSEKTLPSIVPHVRFPSASVGSSLPGSFRSVSQDVMLNVLSLFLRTVCAKTYA